MQYQVPQFIDIEDKIVGPLTIKQFLFLAGGGVMIFLLIFLLKLALAILFGIPILIVSVALAFGKVRGVPMARYLSSVVSFAFKPQKYLWRKAIQKKLKNKD